MGLLDKVADTITKNKESFLKVNSYNFATIINSATNITEIVNDLCEESFNEGKIITEMQLKEQHDRATIEEIRKNTEVLSIPFDEAKKLFGNIYDESTITKAEFMQGNMRMGDQLKAYFDSTKPDNPSYKLAQSYNLANEKTSVLDQLNLTKNEYDRIMGQGKYEGMTFGDYSVGSGATFKEAQLDVAILCKVSNCDIKVGDKFVFENFLIAGGNGDILKVSDMGILQSAIIKNFGGQVAFNKNHEENFNCMLDLIDFNRQHNHSHGSNAKVRLLSRITGFKQMEEEMNQYTSQITKPMHFAKNLHGGTEKVVGGVYGVGKGLYLGGRNREINSTILKIQELEKRLKFAKGKDREKILNELKGLKEKLENLKALFNKKLSGFNNISSVAHYVWNPHKALGKGAGFVGKKITKGIVSSNTFNVVKNSRVGRIAGKVNQKGGVVKRGFANLKRNLYLRIGNFGIGKLRVNAITKFFRKLTLLVIKAIALPLILVVIVLVVCLMGVVSDHSKNAIVVAPLGNDYDYINWQNYYDSLDNDFMKSLENMVQNYAINTNLKGEKIYYGINGRNNEDGMTNTDYQNGMYYKYIVDEEHQGRSSNIEDLISIMSVMMSQQMSDYPELTKTTLTWLYNISHSFNYQESPLYACDSACHNIRYECNDNYHEYTDTDIRYSPFHAVKKSGGDYEIRTSTNYCLVCNQNYNGGSNTQSCHIANDPDATREDYYGCVSHSSCYHGDSGDMGRTKQGCNNYTAHYSCDHDCDNENCTHDCSGSAIGCGGYYECNGHPHYSCDGHDYKCCMGHRDIQMNIRIKFFDEIKDIINKYDFGNNDDFAKELASKE